MNTQSSIISSSDNKYQKSLTIDEIHKKLKKRFYILREMQGLHYYFCSYDFRDNEKDMVLFWSELLNYCYDSIYQTFAIRVSRILDISKIDNNNPIGLENIMVKLIENGEYITEDDLNSNSFYNAINPTLYPSSYLKYFASSLVSTVSSYIYTPPKQKLKKEDIYIHKEYFQQHCTTLLIVLEDILTERVTCVITKKEYANELQIRQVPNGNMYLNLCLLYLSKLKKIALFTITNDYNTECIKLLRDINDEVTTKDNAIINLLICIQSLNKKIKECQKQMEYNHQRSINCLKAKQKENARMCLQRKKMNFNNEQHYSNILFTLERNLEDLNSMESTIEVKNIIEKVNKASKELKINPDEIANTLDELKDMNSAFNDLKSEWEDYAEKDDNDEELNEELEKLNLCIKNEDKGISNEEDEDQKENEIATISMFPQPYNKEKEKEAKIDPDESLRKVLAEYN